MNELAPESSDAQPAANPSPRLSERLPWQKLIIWGLFLLAIYTLRHLFLIIFMTFLLSFLVRMVVVAIASRLSPQRERAWLERLLTLVTFAGMVAVGVVSFNFFAPRIFEQGRALLVRMENTQPQQVIRDFRTRTVGSYLFRQKYGEPDDQPYREAFAGYQETGRFGEGLYNTFAPLRDDLDAGFEAGYQEAETKRLLDDLTLAGPRGNEFDNWFLAEKAAQLFEEREDFYVRRWSAQFATPEGARELARLAEQADFKEARDAQIRASILREVKEDPERHAKVIEEWQQKTIARRWREFRESPEYLAAFQRYFEQEREERPHSIPFDFETYLALKDAFPDKAKFVAVLARPEDASPLESDQQLLTQDFELTLQGQLADEWWTTDPIALWIRGQAKEDLPKVIEAAINWGRDAVRYAATIPIQLTTALLLTIFVTFDMTRIKRQVRRLHDSRMRNVYVEIAPGLVTFGRLIGRAFMAQGLIAVFNTLLTFLLLWLIGIENAFFLGAVVFACSFIPVVGVIISSVPIALMAILQPGGSLWLAAQCILGIIIIHFIETSVLNPNIVGSMLHLHPFVVIAVLTVGEHFFGVWGLLLAVPVWVFIFRVVILSEQIPGISVTPGQPP